MFSIYRNIQRNICKNLKRSICNIKDDHINLRLRHITNILKNKNKYTEYYDNIYLNKMQSYYNDLEKEKNQIFKKMVNEGRLNEYMGMTGDFVLHTYS